MRLGSRPSGAARARAAVTAACLTCAVLVPGAPVQAATTDIECSQPQPDDPVVQTHRTSTPLELMGVPAAQDLLRGLGKDPGAGVNVAVLDSGIARTELIPVTRRVPESSDENLTYYHGTTVAGIIAGEPRDQDHPIGIAPGAGIIDVRVYDTSETDPTEGGARPDAETLAAGLEWVARNAGKFHIGVANVSLAVRPSKRLEVAVRKAWDAGVVVVASSGNRPAEGELDYVQLGKFHPGEDAAKLVYPAGYPHVLAVNATGAGAGEVTLEDSVLHNSRTDVAAPTYRAVSVAINGSTCLVSEIATSWSAAEVSGVMALIRSRYPDDSPAQAVARLLDTASGSPADPTSLEGAGVVQPVEALTRPLPRTAKATHDPVAGRAVPRVTAPEPAADVLAATRDHAVWWGLLGGGALLLAVLVRPVLARRRDAS